MYKKKDMEIIRTTIESLDLKKAKELIENYDINYILSSAILIHFNKLSSNDKTYKYIKYLIRLGGNINSISTETNLPLISRLIWFGGNNPNYRILPLITDIENWKKIINLGLNVNTKWKYRPKWNIIEKEYSIFDAMVTYLNTEGISLLIEKGLDLSKVNFIKPLKNTLKFENNNLFGFLNEENLNKLIALYRVIGVDFTANNNELIKLMFKYNLFDLSRFMINEALEEVIFEKDSHKNKKWLEKKLKALDSSNE